MKIGKYERIQCPKIFQDYLTRIFGINRFGQPMFKIFWGQTETYDYATPTGYGQKTLGHNQPCWMIVRWRPPEIYGTPEIYYRLNADRETGLALMGEYPQFGWYEPLLLLKSTHFDPDTKEMIVETPALDWTLIDSLIPALEAIERLTPEEIALAEQAILEQENRQMVAEITDRLMNALPTWYHATSFASRRNKNSFLQQKEDQIAREWDRRLKSGEIPRQKGFFQEPT